jgi:GMP synthase-like glutamine amidotransferase
MILFIKHVDIEGPETLGVHFAEAGYTIGTCDLHRGGKLPGELSGLDAVISLGGPMNVYEEKEYPFLADEDVFLKKVIAGKVPFLGICLGSQLLAKAAGGRVVRSPQREIGWYTIEMTPAGRRDPLFAGLPSPWEVYQWHGDMCEPLNGEAVLASSARCPVQAIRAGTRAYGLQFHAEITERSIREWSADYAPEKRAEADAMLRRYAELKPEFDRCGRILCENFVKIVRTQ